MNHKILQAEFYTHLYIAVQHLHLAVQLNFHVNYKATVDVLLYMFTMLPDRPVDTFTVVLKYNMGLLVHPATACYINNTSNFTCTIFVYRCTICLLCNN